MQFGEILRSFELPAEWREAIAERCKEASTTEDGVKLRPKGQKLTPTQCKLPLVQIQEARDLLSSGKSLRQVASHLGIGRQTLERLLAREERR